MKLTEEQKNLLETRKQIIRFWPFAITSAVASLAILFFVLLLYTPNLVNPVRVFTLLGEDKLPEGQMVILSAVAPILMITVFLILALMLFFLWVTIKREKRYIEIIEASYEKE